MARLAALIAVLLQLLVLAATPAQASQTNIAAGLLAEGPAMPGSTITLAIDMQPKPGWHGYWQNPGDAGQGMTVDWTLPPGAKVGALAYPVPATLTDCAPSTQLRLVALVPVVGVATLVTSCPLKPTALVVWPSAVTTALV